MENTKYSNSSLGTKGYWLETPSTDGSSRTWDVSASNRYVTYNSASSSGYDGSRPAIEVLKSEIQYQKINKENTKKNKTINQKKKTIGPSTDF